MNRTLREPAAGFPCLYIPFCALLYVTVYTLVRPHELRIAVLRQFNIGLIVSLFALEGLILEMLRCRFLSDARPLERTAVVAGGPLLMWGVAAVYYWGDTVDSFLWGSMVCLVVLLCLACVKVLRSARADLLTHPTVLLVLLFLILCIQGVGFAIYPSVGLAETRSVTIGVLFGFFLCVYGVNRQLRLAILLGVWVLIAGGIVLASWYRYVVYGVTVVAAGGVPTGRMGGAINSLAFRDPNDLAMSLVTVLPFTIALQAQRRGALWRGAWLLCFSVLAMGIALSGSRGGLVASLAMLAVLLVNLRRRALGFIAVYATITGAVWAGAPTVFLQRAGTLLHVTNSLRAGWGLQRAALLAPGAEAPVPESHQPTPGLGRLQIWARGIEVLRQRPCFGVGMGGWSQAWSDQFPELSARAPHNAVLQVLAENGVLAGLIYVCLFASAYLWSCRAGKRATDGRAKATLVSFQASIAGVFVAGLFLSRPYDWLAFQVLAGSVAACSIHSASRCREIQNEPA